MLLPNGKAMGLSPIKRLLSKARLGRYERLEHEPQGLLSEPMFLRALCLERKRAERSRKPFVLMLLVQGGPSHNGNGVGALNKTVSAIVASIPFGLGWIVLIVGPPATAAGNRLQVPLCAS